jgi:hypothetical protein
VKQPAGHHKRKVLIVQFCINSTSLTGIILNKHIHAFLKSAGW